MNGAYHRTILHCDLHARSPPTWPTREGEQVKNGTWDRMRKLKKERTLLIVAIVAVRFHDGGKPQETTISIGVIENVQTRYAGDHYHRVMLSGTNPSN